ncbi:MAG: heme-copper oxidase subunit III [Salinigranum sp.]
MAADSPTEMAGGVTVGEGAEGFPHSSHYPIFVGVGLGLLTVGLVGHLIVLGLGVIVFGYGTLGWAHEYAVVEYGRGIIPEQKTYRNLGYESGTVAIGGVIISEIVVFGALFAAYFALESRNGPWPPSGLPSPDLALAIVLSVVLVASGVTLHWAQANMERGNRRNFWYGLVATVVLGLAFLAGQGYEYSSLVAEGLTPQSSPFGSAFYALTGTHGLHVIVGLLLIGAIAVRAGVWGHFGEERNLMIRTITTYWHFVDAVWLFIVVFVYLNLAA